MFLSFGVYISIPLHALISRGFDSPLAELLGNLKHEMRWSGDLKLLGRLLLLTFSVGFAIRIDNQMVHDQYHESAALQLCVLNFRFY